jgi:MFS superfamily sulfate permease-like transporter
MRNFTTKQLMYMSFYYFWIIFLVACIFHDLFYGVVTGFTFGYFFALFYMLVRTKQVLRLMEDLDDYEPED